MRSSFHDNKYTGSGIIFAVLDTGVNNVGRLRGKVYYASSHSSRDTHGHGTFVSGQLIEWCPDARILSYCVLPGGVGTIWKSVTALADVYRRAAKDKQHQYIVNMSLCAKADKCKFDVVAMKMWIHKLVAINVPVVVAAGNDGGEVLNAYPSCFEDPICVSALDESGNRAEFSTWHNEVDFGEYGVNVEGLAISGGTCYKSGTSMACPNVAGKIGLLASKYAKQKGTRPTEAHLYAELKESAVDLFGVGYDPFAGFGFPIIKV